MRITYYNRRNNKVSFEFSIEEVELLADAIDLFLMTEKGLSFNRTCSICTIA